MKRFDQDISEYINKKSKGEIRYIPKRQTEEEKRKSLSPRIRIQNLEEADGLVLSERRDLETLISTGNYIPTCAYNKRGNVVSLTIGIYGEIPDSINFPDLQELCSSYKNEKDFQFVQKHHKTIKILRIIHENLTIIPDLTGFL